MSPGISSLLWFIAILALIPLALWLLKRTPMGGAAAGGLMRSIAVLPLSTNQRLVTVEVGTGAERRWLVLGVTPHNITTLHSMTPQADATAATPSASMPAGFAQVLSRLRQNGQNNKDAS
jgi:flagellar protein FliO/FliZ